MLTNNVQKWIAIDDLHSASEANQWPDVHRHLLVLTEESTGISNVDIQTELKLKLKGLADV